MKNRIISLLALGGALLSPAAFAENCKNLVLYENGNSIGSMEESTRSFPEAPEWSTNWGDFGTMKNPYIRFSGMRNFKSDWTGSLIFEKLPVIIHGGSLKLKVRSTQVANFGVWLSGSNGNGKISFQTLTANTTHELDIPVSNLIESESVEVNKIGIGLFGVPANQYTTLFVDDIELTCVENEKSNSAEIEQSENLLEEEPYIFSDINVSSPERSGLFEDVFESKVQSHFSKQTKDSLSQITSSKFVISEEAYLKLLSNYSEDTISPSKSRNNWYNSLFILEKGGIQENYIPNSKQIFDEAGEISAQNDNTIIPILFADLDFSVLSCIDSLCTTKELEDSRIITVGLPTSNVNGSKIRLVYDPYFAISPKGVLPNLEICSASNCIELKPKSGGILEFESAGIQKIQAKIHSDGGIVKQNLFVEVK